MQMDFGGCHNAIGAQFDDVSSLLSCFVHGRHLSFLFNYSFIFLFIYLFIFALWSFFVRKFKINFDFLVLLSAVLFVFCITNGVTACK